MCYNFLNKVSKESNDQCQVFVSGRNLSGHKRYAGTLVVSPLPIIAGKEILSRKTFKQILLQSGYIEIFFILIRYCKIHDIFGKTPSGNIVICARMAMTVSKRVEFLAESFVMAASGRYRRQIYRPLYKTEQFRQTA